MRRCILGTSLAVAAAIESPTLPTWLSRRREANVATCAVDVGAATSFLGFAGLAINGAVRTCGNTGPSNTTATCEAEVGGVVASLGYGAGFLSGAAAECRASLDVVEAAAVLREGCAASVAMVTAALGLLVNAGSHLSQSCLNTTAAPVAGARRLLQGDRVLLLEKLEEAAEKLEASSAKRSSAQKAACAMDVGQFTFLMARAGLMVNYAVTDCSAAGLRAGGSLRQAKCVADLGRILSAFGLAASGMAYAVFGCPVVMENVDAVCAGSIVNLVAGTAELVGNGANLQATCRAMALEPSAQKKLLEAVADPERRRLQEEPGQFV